MLKVGWRHSEAEQEADCLRAWNGRGAILVHESWACDATSALLLERCQPGSTLASVAAEFDQDEVVAGLLFRLWSTPVDRSFFRPLTEMCDAWASEFEVRLAASPGVLDPGLARAGIELLRGLPGTADSEVLLATDLHAGNVLASRREPWLAIDPKPYFGDPTYDALQHLLNCEERLAADPVGLVNRLAHLLALSPERLTQWLFARCVQESIDQPQLREVAATLAP